MRRLWVKIEPANSAELLFVLEPCQSITIHDTYSPITKTDGIDVRQML